MFDLTAAVIGLLFVLSATLPFWFAYHDARYRKQTMQRWSTRDHVSDLPPTSIVLDDANALAFPRKKPADEPVQFIMDVSSAGTVAGSSNVCLNVM